MYCTKCGMENSDDAQFCTNCGEMLASENGMQKEFVRYRLQGEGIDEGAAVITNKGVHLEGTYFRKDGNGWKKSENMALIPLKDVISTGYEQWKTGTAAKIVAVISFVLFIIVQMAGGGETGWMQDAIMEAAGINAMVQNAIGGITTCCIVGMVASLAYIIFFAKNMYVFYINSFGGQYGIKADKFTENDITRFNQVLSLEKEISMK